MTEKLYWYWLTGIPGIGPRKTEHLLERFGTPGRVFRARPGQLEGIPGITGTDINKICSSRDEEAVKKNYDSMERQGIRLITRQDSEYPEQLAHIYDAPWVLYVKGKPLQLQYPMVAVVGARECSAYGEAIAKKLGAELSRAGVIVVSGMAAGIDSFAHKGVLQNDGITYAVMGCGIDKCYPASGIDLYMRIQKRGAILSEYPPGYPSAKGCFPMRNRIICGMCQAVVVVEARKRSGSLITADMALEQGKDVFVVPGRLGDALSEGCHRLLQEGAIILTNVKDILENMDIGRNFIMKNLKIANYLLEKEEQMVYSNLRLEPLHINEIVYQCGLPFPTVQSALVKLEMRGRVCEYAPGYYVRQDI